MSWILNLFKRKDIEEVKNVFDKTIASQELKTTSESSIPQNKNVIDNDEASNNLSQKFIDSYVGIELAKEKTACENNMRNKAHELGLEFLIDLEFQNDKDPLFNESARVVVQMQSGSFSNLQRHFNLGYNRAIRILDQLEAAGIVGPAIGSRPREVYLKNELELDFFLNQEFSPNSDNFLLQNKDLYEENRYEIEKLIFEGKMQIHRAMNSLLEKLEEAHARKISIEKEKVRKKLLDKEKGKQLQREVYKELLDAGHIKSNESNDGRRERISQEVMDQVWNRDGGRCVKCGSQENLEFDHIIPFSKGGANTYRNLQILCEKCNIEKSNKIG